MALGDYDLSNILDRIRGSFSNESVPLTKRQGIVAEEVLPKRANRYLNPVVRSEVTRPQQATAQLRAPQPNYQYADKAPFPQDLIPALQSASGQYGVNRDILAALIAQETGGLGTPYSPQVSSAGARGVAQIIPKWHYAAAGYQNPLEYANRLDTDPAFAISEGARILSEYLGQAEGDYGTALAAYNAGFGNIGAGSGYAQDVLGRVSGR